MPIGNTRVGALAALHYLLFCLVPAQAPSNPMRFEDPLANAPSAAEIELFEELVEWIADEEPGPAAEGQPLRRVIRARPASFDVFRSYLDTATRNELLNELPYGDAIRRAAERHGVDALLVAAIVEVESSFDPCAISHRGAVGLMQVMPATAGLTEYDLLADPRVNVELGTGYLRHLLKIYDGDLELALAAYNAGPANVRRYGGLPPFRETRRYVEKVLDVYIDHHQTAWRGSDTLEALGLSQAS